MRPNQARRKLCSYVEVIARYAAQRTFGVLPPQDMQVGGLSLHKISFVTLAAAKDVPKAMVTDCCQPRSSGVSTSATPIALLFLSRGRAEILRSSKLSECSR
jgi:hypothetical protein